MALATPDFLQVKTYTAKALRAALMDRSIQSGVIGATDFQVTQRGAGATMSVDVGAGSAWVLGTTSSRQGAYHAYNDAAVNVAVNSNASGNPRIDQVVLHIYDSIDGAAGTDVAAIEVVQGTATAGATLNNRLGAAALPANCLLLADVLVANAAASITNTVIRDRRPWARGATWSTTRLANGAAGNDYTNSSNAAYALVDATNLQPRLECSGGPVLVTTALQGTVSVASQAIYVALMIDGVAPTIAATQFTVSNANFDGNISFSQVVTPAAGSHLIGLAFRPSGAGATATLRAQALAALSMSVQELVRPNTANNAVTSG